MATRIMVVGSIMSDVILQMEQLPQPSESILGRQYGYAVGGKGANAAVAAARLGADVRFYGSVGVDKEGKRLLASLRHEGVDIQYVEMKKNVESGTSFVLLESGGKNRIIVFQGANNYTKIDALPEAMRYKPDALMMQLEIPLETNAAALTLAKQNSIITCLDAGPAKKMDLEAFRGVTILSPNETETQALTGIYPIDDLSCIAASRELRDRSDCLYVVTKLGERGAYIYGGGISQRIPPYSVNSLDPTAAGDAFTAGMVKHFAESHDIVAAVQYANAVGALTCQTLGAQPSIPGTEQVEAFLKKVVAQL